MTELLPTIETLPFEEDIEDFTTQLKNEIEKSSYEIVEENLTKPWGAYLRIDSSQADEFVHDFFPDLTPTEARMNIDGAELSPKFLIVKPGQRLSWQYHDRRAERWHFLTTGAYRRSKTDEESERYEAKPGEVVQFEKGERHRLEGVEDGLVLVAEIWQHTDGSNPSNEDDIVRLADDYSR